MTLLLLGEGRRNGSGDGATTKVDEENTCTCVDDGGTRAATIPIMPQAMIMLYRLKDARRGGSGIILATKLL